MELAKVKNVANRWLYLEDDTYIDVVLATVIAHGFGGDPLWLMLIGSSGSGKTEVLRALYGPRVHHMSDLTPHALVSGLKQSKGDPSVLPDLDGKVWVIKDLTTLLSQNPRDRAKIFGQLRDVYDGFTSKAFGSGVGCRSHACSVGLIAGVTPAIERYQAMDQSLGERFVNYRLAPADADRQVGKAMENVGRQEEMRHEISTAVIEFLHRDWPATADGITTSRTHMDQIKALSIVTAQLRTQVPKNRAGVASFVPEPEAGTRLAMQLTKLAKALTMVRGTSTFSDAEYEVVRKVAEDCIPSVRLRLVSALADLAANGFVDTSTVAARSLMPLPSTRVGLEDLRLLGLAESAGSSPLRWRLKPQLCERLSTAGFVLSENKLRLSVVQMPMGTRS